MVYLLLLLWVGGCGDAALVGNSLVEFDPGYALLWDFYPRLSDTYLDIHRCGWSIESRDRQESRVIPQGQGRANSCQS